eukprot:301867-Amorphochlora_amoeboformis.AAC.1
MLQTRVLCLLRYAPELVKNLFREGNGLQPQPSIHLRPECDLPKKDMHTEGYSRCLSNLYHTQKKVTEP